MNSLNVAFVCLFLFVITVLGDKESSTKFSSPPTNENERPIKQNNTAILEACAAENNITYDDFRRAESGLHFKWFLPSANTRAVKCTVSCALRKRNVIVDGKLSLGGIILDVQNLFNFGDSVKSAFLRATELCYREAQPQTDECELGYSYDICLSSKFTDTIGTILNNKILLKNLSPAECNMTSYTKTYSTTLNTQKCLLGCYYNAMDMIVDGKLSLKFLNFLDKQLIYYSNTKMVNEKLIENCPKRVESVIDECEMGYIIEQCDMEQSRAIVDDKNSYATLQLKKCALEIDIPDLYDTLERLNNDPAPKTHAENCIIGCVFRKNNMIENGTLSLEVWKQLVQNSIFNDQEKKFLILNTYDVCEKKAKLITDECAMGDVVSNCIMEHRRNGDKESSSKSSLPRTNEIERQIKRENTLILEACAAENNITADHFRTADSGIHIKWFLPSENTRAVNCTVSCVLRKRNVIVDGMLSLGGIILDAQKTLNFGESVKSAFLKATELCYQEAQSQTDECELASFYDTCVSSKQTDVLGSILNNKIFSKQPSPAECNMTNYIKTYSPTLNTTYAQKCLLGCLFNAMDMIVDGKFSLQFLNFLDKQFIKNSESKKVNEKIIENCPQTVESVTDECEMGSIIGNCNTEQNKIINDDKNFYATFLLQKCATEINVPDLYDTVERLKKDPAPKTNAEKCIIGCVFRENDMIVNGTLSLEDWKERVQNTIFIDQEKRSYMMNSYDVCAKRAELITDECAMGDVVSTCLMEHRRNFTIAFPHVEK